MCGLNGFFDYSRSTSEQGLREIGHAGAELLRHRGPDDSGLWWDASQGVVLGHRRLSIIDLTPEGHQPMLSRDGRYVIVFNGEIYNYRWIRGELDREGGTQWRGHSDTEVLLEAFSRWGADRTLRSLNGMFAIALWDRHKRELLLVRDRIGEKPLYYAAFGSAIVFGSELRSLRVHPQWRDTISIPALRLLFRHNYVPGPFTIYAGARKLLPGYTVRVDSDGALHHEQYWSAGRVAERGASQPSRMHESEAVDELHRLLSEAVQMRMEADVPVGAFLSGGVDSSTVVGLMQEHSSRPVRTFSIGFREQRYNEAAHAKAVARHIGTDHTELYVTPEQACAVVTDLPRVYDEPFADSSQIPTVLLAALVRRHVTVSLSGDGGDELFCGYTRYDRLLRDWRRVRRVPSLVRRAGATALGIVGGGRVGELLGAFDARDFYLRKVAHWPIGEEPVVGGEVVASPAFAVDTALNTRDFDVRMLAMDLDVRSYLPDDILVKVDRATMAVALEARVPLLDHRVVEWAGALPLHLKSRSSTSKWLLRQVAYRYVPQLLLERPKQGFAVPLAAWLRGGLREWAESLLNDCVPPVDAAVVARLWKRHLEGYDESGRIWTVLMFNAWISQVRAPAYQERSMSCA